MGRKQNKEYACGTWPRNSLTDIRKARNQARVLIESRSVPTSTRKPPRHRPTPQLGGSLDVIDRRQNHVLAGSRVRRHYLHHDYAEEKKRAWNLLGDQLSAVLSSAYEHTPKRVDVVFSSVRGARDANTFIGCCTQSFPEFNIRDCPCCDLKFAMSKGDRMHVNICELHRRGTVRQIMANAHG